MVEALIRGSKITLIYNLFNFYFKPIQLDPSQVFTNSELRLTDIEVIGFDYDYTLAPYTGALESTIFNMIIEGLVSSRHYPPVSV